MTNTILVVDDDPVQRRLLEAAITKAGHSVIKAENGKQALECLSQDTHQIKAVVLDLMMPELDGMGVMQEMETLNINVPVIVQTAKGGIETVVGAMRLGAFDFVVKPVSPERIQSAIQKVLKLESTFSSSNKIKKTSKSRFGFKDIISSNAEMDKVLRIGQKAAASQIPVLIEGESGVGKELVAKAIQGSSDRADKPFVTVNCGALPENLVESILFGHEKGAFTGASEKHVGKFAEANNGTLFLDEVGELPLDLQVKLLRAIQEGVIDPIGSKNPTKVDIRLISATNRDLQTEVKEGRFREDLFYRLNVLPIRIPALRQRRDDIQALVFHFVKKICREENRNNISAVHPKLMTALNAYDWPGNIRELENAIFRAIVLCEGNELVLDDFPQIASQMDGFSLGEPMDEVPFVEAPSITTPDSSDLIGVPCEPDYSTNYIPAPEKQPTQKPTQAEQLTATGNYGMINLISEEGQIRQIEEIEKEMVEFAIEIYNGRMSEVARRLGIGRSTLYRKLKDFGLEDSSNNEPNAA